jgi:hypothetical protein
MLDRTGKEMAEILSLIPGLAGTLNSETEPPGTLTHLRIVLSASELAMLPFELSKVPAGAGSSGGWLALQARVPVCITRHIRSVSASGMRWPIEPRILFVAGPDTPFERHLNSLHKAFAPWSDEKGWPGDRLVSLKEATLARIVDKVTNAAQCRAPFTHIHILAHGARLDEEDSYSPHGVALYDKVISGRRLATALSGVAYQGVCRPAVVTLAACESAEMPDVRTPDASVAHDLHDQGIPLVVASQFPLSVEGSVPFVERFYTGQLSGEHPLVSLYEVRRLLHSRMSAEVHDWASLVVYEAFPSDLPEQLEEVRYSQTRSAQNNALNRIEALVDQPASDQSPLSATEGGDSTRHRYDELRTGVEQASMQLPDRGPYALECAGLRAAGQKRLAEAAFFIAIKEGISEVWRENLFSQCLADLNQARAAYWKATKAYLGSSSELTRRKANLHWLLGQVLFLDVVLGVPSREHAWAAGRLAAQIDTESPSEVASAALRRRSCDRRQGSSGRLVSTHLALCRQR